MIFAQPAWLYALSATPAALLLAAIAARRSARMRRALVGALGPYLVHGRRPVLGSMRALLAALALGLLAFALAQPRWDPKRESLTRVGRDVVFVIDVSRSMLARDLRPTRLARTQLWIKDLLPHLDGDRVGLVAFAGSAVIKCPLTYDYNFFAMSLESLSPDGVARGGTLIGDALRKIADEVFPEEGAARDIILITDGEDQESFPTEAAKRLGDRGVRIIALGIGGDSTPVPGVTFNNRPVTSSLDSGSLREIAAQTPGGSYVQIGTGDADLPAIYESLMASAQQAESTAKASAIEYHEGFQWFVLAGIICLFMEAALAPNNRR